MQEIVLHELLAGRSPLIAQEPGDIDVHPEIYRDAEGALRAAGAVRLPEMGEHLGVELEHEDVDSVSGLVLHLLGRPARRGDVVEYHLRFEVMAVVGHGVEQCRVTPAPEEHGPAPAPPA